MGRLLFLIKMSNVFKRFHTPTGNEYWDTAMEIETQLMRFLLNQKNFSKRHLYIYVIPTKNDLQTMQNAIVEAKTIYPSTPELVDKKKDAFLRATIACEQIIQDIQRAVLALPAIDVNKLDGLGKLLQKESGLLRKCRSKVRLQSANPF